MDPHLFNSHPPPISAYQSYMGSPHHSINPYQPSNMTPYPTMPNEYMTPRPSQMYLHQPPPPSIHPPLFDGYPYNHPIYDEEPSCFESFLENFCCCFGFGVPQNHYEAMAKHEIQRRRLIAKEERNRMAQYQKLQQEKQRLAQIQQQQQKQQQTNTTAVNATNTTATTASDQNNVIQ